MRGRCYEVEMRKALSHPLTNLSGIGGVISFCVQNWLSDWLAAQGIQMSWGWLGAVLLAIWVGAQLRQLESGDHWLQDSWKKFRAAFEIDEMRGVQRTGRPYALVIDTVVRKNITNVRIVVDVYEHEAGQLGSWWTKIQRANLLQKGSHNVGDEIAVPVMFIQDRPAPAGREVQSEALAKRGFYMARLTITCAERPKFQKHVQVYFDPSLPGGNIFPMPLDTPNDYSDDGADLKIFEADEWKI